MAAINWIEIRGQKFSEDEAREASDFQEVLDNFGMEPDQWYSLFRDEGLSVPRRAVLAEIVSVDILAEMIFNEKDSRVRGIIQNRLGEERSRGIGNIIC